MSEFKYACPVCGQHMMCDSSHGGSVMECPTCFQKIVAPQAPAPDSKFILTGTKLTEKKIAVRGAEGPVTAVAEKNFPWALTLTLIVGAALATAALAYFKFSVSTQPPAATNTVTTPKPVVPPKPAPVAPPASDTNWTLSAATNTIPGSPVAGRIHGQDFIVERVSFQNGTLTLRQGTRGPLEFGVQINFGNAQPESLSGKTIHVAKDALLAARVTLFWKEGDAIRKTTFTNAYALHLEFGSLAKERLPGKIHLCTPDAEKSYLIGTFNAEARKPKPKPPKS